MYAWINVDYTNHVNRPYASAYSYTNGAYDSNCYLTQRTRAQSTKNGSVLVTGTYSQFDCFVEGSTDVVACGGGHLWASRNTTEHDNFNVYTLNSSGQATAC